MDPIAHTLAGAALAETGLRRKTRYATATLMIGANLPDIDVIATFWGSDPMLYWRRGWSHGILAMIVLPLLLAAAVWIWHRWRGRQRPGDLRYRPGMILLLSYLAVLSHPMLDWLNTYGVRLLMPFDGRWFYGDTLYIIDPWMWLLAGSAILMGRHGSRTAMAAGLIMAGAAGSLLLFTNVTPLLVKLSWCVAAAGLLVVAWRLPRRVRPEPLAGSCLVLLALYIALTGAMARQVEAQQLAEYPMALQAQTNPIPGTPFRHRVVLMTPDHYRLITAQGEEYRLPRPEPDPIIEAALADPSIKGFVNWMRFPYYEVVAEEDGWAVHIRDLRYQGPDEPPATIGHTVVHVPTAAVDVSTDQ